MDTSESSERKPFWWDSDQENKYLKHPLKSKSLQHKKPPSPDLNDSVNSEELLSGFKSDPVINEDDLNNTEIDKLKFFENLQSGDQTIDYAKLNQELESDESMLDPNASWLQSIETPVQGAPVIQIKAPQDVTGLAPDHPSDAQKGDVPLSGLVLSDVDVTNDIAADNVQKATTMADAKQDLAPESIIPLSRADPITESESKDFGVSEAQDLSIQEESHPLSVQEESHALSFEESQSLSLEEESVIESQPLSTGEKKETKDKETYSMSFESVSDINNQILQENSAIQEASLLLTDKPTDLEPRNVVNPLPQEIVSSKVSDPTGYGEDMDTTSLGSENPMSYAAVHSPVIESKPEPVQSTPKPKTDTPGQKNLTFEDFLAMNDLEPKKKSPKRLPEKKEILKRTNAKFAKTKEPAKQKNQVTPKRETRIGTRSADVKSRDSKIGKPTPEKPVLKERPQAQEKPQIVEKPETVESTSLDRAISDEKNVIERRLAELETLATTQKQEIHNLLERESLAKQESTELKEQVRFLEQMLEDERTSQRLVTHAKQGLLTEEEASKLRKQMEEQEHLITGYQVENERLVQQVKEIKALSKETEQMHFIKQETLSKEIATLKTQLSAPSGSSDLSVSKLKTRIESLESQITQLKHNALVQDEEHQATITALNAQIQTLAAENTRLQAADPEKMERIKKEHEQELEKFKSYTLELETRLEWALEHLDLVDDNQGEVESLKKSNSELFKELQQLGKTRAVRRSPADIKKISELERKTQQLATELEKQKKVSLESLSRPFIDPSEHLKLLKSKLRKAEQDLDDYKQRANAEHAQMMQERLERLQEHEKTIRDQAETIEQLLQAKKIDDNTLIIELENKDLKQRIKELEQQTTVPDDETSPIQAQRKILELESLVDQHVIRNKQLSHDMQQLQKDIAFRMQEKDDMILSYENKIIQLQKEFKDKLFLVDQSKQLDERHLLKQELANCHAEIISLKSKLEISEGTRKAIHETTISLLKQAQEESSKLALSHHERSLEVLRRELKGDLRPESPVKIKELEASLEQANVKIGQLNAKIQTLVAEKSELKTKAVQLQDERLLLDQELEQLRSLLERSKSGLPPSVQQFQQLVTKIQQLESELERRTEFLEHDPKDCQHEKDQLVNLLRQKDQDISKFQTKIASLLTGIQLLKSR